MTGATRAAEGLPAQRVFAGAIRRFMPDAGLRLAGLLTLLGLVAAGALVLAPPAQAITGRLRAAIVSRGPTSAPPVADPAPPRNPHVILATTTSTHDSGLLDVLLPLFERQTGYRVKTIAVGTGAALALGARGEADMLLVHAPQAEEQWMAAGFGTARLPVMHNDFVIAGPRGDPAGLRGERSAVAALRRVAEQRATWIGRDDGSGTDLLEKRLWGEAGGTPAGQPWYVTSGQGMGATLVLADHLRAYLLADRATYLARRAALELVPLVEGDPHLLNRYHVLVVNAARFPALPINAAGAAAFATFLTSPETQRLIGEFRTREFGQPLFVPDALAHEG